MDTNPATAARNRLIDLAASFTTLSYVATDDELASAASDAGAAVTRYIDLARRSSDSRAFLWFTLPTTQANLDDRARR